MKRAALIAIALMVLITSAIIWFSKTKQHIIYKTDVYKYDVHINYLNREVTLTQIAYYMVEPGTPDNEETPNINEASGEIRTNGFIKLTKEELKAFKRVYRIKVNEEGVSTTNEYRAMALQCLALMTLRGNDAMSAEDYQEKQDINKDGKLTFRESALYALNNVYESYVRHKK